VRYPEWQTKLRKEVDDTVRASVERSGPSAFPGLDDLAEWRILNAVMWVELTANPVSCVVTLFWYINTETKHCDFSPVRPPSCNEGLLQDQAESNWEKCEYLAFDRSPHRFSNISAQISSRGNHCPGTAIRCAPGPPIFLSSHKGLLA
jgi:hypothetical protein